MDVKLTVQYAHEALRRVRLQTVTVFIGGNLFSGPWTLEMRENYGPALDASAAFAIIA